MTNTKQQAFFAANVAFPLVLLLGVDLLIRSSLVAGRYPTPGTLAFYGPAVLLAAHFVFSASQVVLRRRRKYAFAMVTSIIAAIGLVLQFT